MKYFAFILSFILILSIFVLPASAASYSAWGSVQDSNSQVQQLIQYYLQFADPLYDFIVIRIEEYQYRLFYSKNLSEDQIVSYIDLTRYQQSGYTTEWRFSTGSDSNFSFNLGNYTAVGNIPGDKILYSSTFDSFKTNFIIRIILISLFIVFVFISFRIHISKRREVKI